MTAPRLIRSRIAIPLWSLFGLVSILIAYSDTLGAQQVLGISGLALAISLWSYLNRARLVDRRSAAAYPHGRALCVGLLLCLVIAIMIGLVWLRDSASISFSSWELWSIFIWVGGIIGIEVLRIIMPR